MVQSTAEPLGKPPFLPGFLREAHSPPIGTYSYAILKRVSHLILSQRDKWIFLNEKQE